MKPKLFLLALIYLLATVSCAKSLTPYEAGTLRSAADGASNAANETEKEVAKIQSINQSLQNQIRTQ